MKTPLNRLLDTLEGGYIIGDVKPNVLAKFIKSELLEYEKKIIMEAFYEGMRCQNFDPNMGRAELYYNETFNTKEK